MKRGSFSVMRRAAVTRLKTKPTVALTGPVAFIHGAAGLKLPLWLDSSV
jgi:hypothetical protein